MKFDCTFPKSFVRSSLQSLDFLSGTLQEVPSLEASLYSKDDIKVSLQSTKWTWSPEEQFPPLKVIKATPLWSSNQDVVKHCD